MNTPIQSTSTAIATRALPRRLWRIVRWPLGLLALAVFGLFALNAFDDSLSPEAAALRQMPVSALTDDENLYVSFAGIDAPSGTSTMEQGQRNIAALTLAIHGDPSGSGLSEDVGRTPAEQRFLPEMENEQWPVLAGSIWDAAREKNADVQALVAGNAELLARYMALHEMDGYIETAPPHMDAAVFVPSAQLRRLYLADVAWQMQSGLTAERSAALSSLSRDMDMWLRVFHGEGGLISKLVAVAAIHADLLVLSDAIGDPSIPVEVFSASAGTWLNPIPLDQWKLGNAVAAEFRTVATVHDALAKTSAGFSIEASDGSPWWSPVADRVGRWFYLPDSTLNLTAQRAQVAEQGLNADPDTIGVDAKQSSSSDARDSLLSFPGVLRNPVGKILVEIYDQDFGNYALRAWDVAALQRAVVLSYQLRLQGVGDSDVGAFAVTHPEWSTHPVGHVSFVWNADKRELAVPQQAMPQRDRRFAVRVHPSGAGSLVGQAF